jgi:hypothetical protein
MSKIRDIWSPFTVINIFDSNFETSMKETITNIVNLTKDKSFFTKDYVSYFQDNINNSSSVSSIEFRREKSVNFNFSLNKSGVEYLRLNLGMLEKENSNLSNQDFAILIGELFTNLTQLMSFETSLFSNEIFDLFNRLISQIKMEFISLFRHADLATLKRFKSSMEFKLYLVDLFFEMLWHFVMRLLLLVKVCLFGMTNYLKNKGVKLDEPYLSKTIFNSYFMLNNICKRTILGLEEFLKELFQEDIYFEEFSGLKKIFLKIYNRSKDDFFENLSFFENSFTLTQREEDEMKKLKGKVSQSTFLNFLWRTELNLIKNLSVTSLRNLSIDIENEDWSDMNVSFDIIDKLNFIVNSNKYCLINEKNEQTLKFEIKAENTKLIIHDQYFRYTSVFYI